MIKGLRIRVADLDSSHVSAEDSDPDGEPLQALKNDLCDKSMKSAVSKMSSVVIVMVTVVRVDAGPQSSNEPEPPSKPTISVSSSLLSLISISSLIVSVSASVMLFCLLCMSPDEI